MHLNEVLQAIASSLSQAEHDAVLTLLVITIGMPLGLLLAWSLHTLRAALKKHRQKAIVIKPGQVWTAFGSIMTVVRVDGNLLEYIYLGTSDRRFVATRKDVVTFWELVNDSPADSTPATRP